MTVVRLHHSNRLEVLAAGLAHLMRTDPGDPFAPERIVVPHPTIGRWLSLELARELGIAANVRYEQPAEFAWSIMRGVVPELSREQPYAPARLRWRIHDLLPGPPAESGGLERQAAGGEPASVPRGASAADGGAPALGGAVGGYLRDGDPRKRLELADRLARMYDQCLLYRPDWIREWESGSAPHWQARLWQRVVGTDGAGGADHWVGALERFRRKLHDGDRAAAVGDGSAARDIGAPSVPPDRAAPADDGSAARGIGALSVPPDRAAAADDGSAARGIGAPSVPPDRAAPADDGSAARGIGAPSVPPDRAAPADDGSAARDIGAPSVPPDRFATANDASSARAPESPPHGESSAGFARPQADTPSSPDEDSFPPPRWPRRASFFAVPALSPSYLELLCEAARGMEIHLFVLNPCREYWGDIHSRREIDHRAEGADPDTRYFTEGNELLAAWGRAGRDMIDALVEVPGADWEERFVEPESSGHLAAVQRDILDLRLAGDAARDDESPVAGSAIGSAIGSAAGGQAVETPVGRPDGSAPDAGPPAGTSGGSVAVSAGEGRAVETPVGRPDGSAPDAGPPAGTSGGSVAVSAGEGRAVEATAGRSDGSRPDAGPPAGTSGGSVAVSAGEGRAVEATAGRSDGSRPDAGPPAGTSGGLVAVSAGEGRAVETPVGRPDGSAPDAGPPAGTSGGSVAVSAGEGRAVEAPVGRPDESAPDAGLPAGTSGGLDIRPPGETGRPATVDSIQVHVCHSPVREAEVLHDRLLAVFDAHPDLEPADVLVLTPDLETYGPAVEAVFAAAGRIPCHVARARAAESRTLRAFLDLLSLPSSRHGAEPVLAPLAAPAVGVRFGIGAADVATIRGWVREAGIRWGVDAAHRGEEDLPETADHTWRHGLRRLLLGYAMADAAEPVAGLVPCRGEEGGFGFGEMDGELLGRFVSYCERVFGLRARLGGSRPPARWGAVLRDLVRDFLADGSERVRGAGAAQGWALARGLAEESAAVRALIRDFENESSLARVPVPLEVVVDVLRERAGETAREAARLADGVTVAGLGAGRIVPAAVVCVVGMNDGVFPRSPSTPSFDVVAAGRARRGDRDIRREDRFAFLEALLAVRRCFLVTCAGRGLRDDAPIPPSVLVDELKDYLGHRFPGEAFETRHPLQPFSPRYFEAVGESRGNPESAKSSSAASPAVAVVAGSEGDVSARAGNGAIGRAPGTGTDGAVVGGGSPEAAGATPGAPSGAPSGAVAGGGSPEATGATPGAPSGALFGAVVGGGSPEAAGVTPGVPSGAVAGGGSPEATGATPGAPSGALFGAVVGGGSPEAAGVTPGVPSGAVAGGGSPEATGATPGAPSGALFGAVVGGGSPEAAGVTPGVPSGAVAGGGSPEATGATPGAPSGALFGAVVGGGSPEATGATPGASSGAPFGGVVGGGSPEAAGATPGVPSGAPSGATGADGNLFSYSRGMCEAAWVVRSGTPASETPLRFAGVALPAPDASRRTVDLAELVAFFANPTRFFLRDRLGVRLELDDLTLEDEEPFELDNLERHRLRSDIWDQMQAGIRPERGAALLHGSGRLPQAGLGRIVHGSAREEVEPLEALLAPHRRALDAQPRPVDFELGGFRVMGAIEHVEPSVGGSNGAESGGTEAGETEPEANGSGLRAIAAGEENEAEPGTMVWWRMGALRAQDRIGVRLRQLAWAAAGHGSLQAIVVSRERGAWKSAVYPPPGDAHEELGRWLDAWWQGLAAPLPFFPETSFAFASAIASVAGDGDAIAESILESIPESSLEAAREKAHVAWLGDPYRPGPAEGADLYRALVHDVDDPLAGGFEDLAVKLLVPLARARP